MATSQKQDIDLGITRYEYGDITRKQVGVLQIETSKYYSGGLLSDAGVYWAGAHCRQNCMSLSGDGGDYGKRLKFSGRDLKATQKAIDRQHAEVFTVDVVADLVRYAKLHYAAVVRAGGQRDADPEPVVARAGRPHRTRRVVRNLLAP